MGGIWVCLTIEQMEIQIVMFVDNYKLYKKKNRDFALYAFGWLNEKIKNEKQKGQ